MSATFKTAADSQTTHVKSAFKRISIYRLNNDADLISLKTIHLSQIPFYRLILFHTM